MYSLISGFWDYFFSKNTIHLLIIGLDHAGKTTLLESIKTKFGKFGIPRDKIPPTVGCNLAKINYYGNQLVLWDLGGQIKMRGIWEKYYDSADAVIYVVDSSDIGRITESKQAFASASDSENLINVPVFIFATKQDLKGAVSSEDISDTFNNLNSKRERIKVFPISAVTGQGMDAALSSVVDRAIKHSKKTAT